MHGIARDRMGRQGIIWDGTGDKENNKERKGKERKGKERKGKERNCALKLTW